MARNLEAMLQEIMDTSNIDDSLFSEVGNFYLNNDKLHDVQFIVGEQKETIKAVRLLLIGQSRAWWNMLSEDSPLAEKGDIHLPDIDPEVFNLLLKHSYGGLSNLDDLSDDMVMKLCYCADKYFMKSLFEKISTRLQPKAVKDLFPALHCLVYYNLQGVEDGVKKMVRTQTTTILDHPEFLECDADSVTYICKQETLNCDELTLWKAVVKWAKHKAQSAEGARLRQWMSSPLQHIRLITLSAKDLRDHVFGLEVLNSGEIANICKKDTSSTPLLCGEISPRFCVSENVVVRKVDVVQSASNKNEHYLESKTSTSCFIIKNKNIELQSLVIRGYVDSTIFQVEKEYLFFGYNPINSLSLKITRITNLMNNTFDEQPVVIKLKRFNYSFLQKVTVPTLIDGKGITLLANSKYKIEFSFGIRLPCWGNPDCVNGHDFEHGTFHCSLVYNNGVGLSPCHILHFTYSVADD